MIMKSENAEGPEYLRLVVGVTGHKNLGEDAATLQALREAVQAAFKNIKELAGSDPLPLLVLSPLAQGADRLVVEEARKCGHKQLVVPLPLPKSSYLDRFPEGREEFEAVASQATQVFYVGPKPLPDLTDDGIRHEQFARLTGFISINSHVLIALWDGQPNTEKHFTLTAKAVDQMLHALPAPPGQPEIPTALLDPAENGIVYHIQTPYGGQGIASKTCVRYISGEISDEEKGEKGGKRGHDPVALEAKIKAIQEKILRRMAGFNADVDALYAKKTRAEVLELGRKELFSAAEPEHLPPSLERLCLFFGQADQLAIHFQKQAMAHFIRVRNHLIAGTALFGVAAHAEHYLPILHGKAGQLLGAGALLAFGALMVRVQILIRQQRAEGQSYQNRYEDYRALAEGLRVQLFWRLAGVPDTAARFYLHETKSELDWIRNALRTWDIFASDLPWIHEGIRTHDENGEAPIKDIPESVRRELVTLNWIQDQLAYFDSRHKRLHHEHHQAETRIKGFVWATVGLGVLGVVLNLLAAFHGEKLHMEHTYPTVFSWLVLLLHLCLLWAAATHITAEKRAGETLAKQYERQYRLFKSAETRLQKTPEDFLDIVRALGQAALAEHGDWVMTRRERPLELDSL